MDEPIYKLAGRRRIRFWFSWFLFFAPGPAAMLLVLRSNGFQWLDLPLFFLFSLLFGLLAYGFAVAITGWLILRRGADPAGINQGVPWNAREPLPATAILMPVYNEDVGRVFAGIRAMFRSLQNTPGGQAFDFFVLSDSSDPNCWIEEEIAWLNVCRELDAFGRIFYRRRRVRLHNKSGNIADFCRRWGAKYRYMIVLDADSVMTGPNLVRMAVLMERNPSAGIIQSAPRLVAGESLFRRVQQFNVAAYGDLFLAGANYWQLDTANFWGHNAILRVAPFIEHCALPELPKVAGIGGRILSHDTVEAALMRRAGFRVWLVPELEGTWEEGPPNLIESAKRDRRWCLGNLQHLILLRLKGLKPVSRFHIMIGVFSYASGLLWFLLLLLSSFPGQKPFTSSTVSNTGRTAGLALLAYTVVLLFGPKILGLLQLAKKREKVARMGGMLKVLGSAGAELIFSSLQAPILMLFYTRFVIGGLLGTKVQWGTQAREGNRSLLRDVIKVHWSHTAVGIVWALALYRWNRELLPWMSPVLAGLIFSIPFSYFTSWNLLGDGLRQRGLLLIPEETAPPQELVEAEQSEHVLRVNPIFRSAQFKKHRGILQVALDPLVHSLHLSLIRQRKQPAEQTRAENRQICECVLASGPDACKADDQAKVLWDAEAVLWLHRELWTRPGSQLHPWWVEAFRLYNLSTELGSREKVRETGY